MRLRGSIYRDGTLWVVEIPLLDAMTQGRSRKEGLAMGKDLVETLADEPGFSVALHPIDKKTFEISSTSPSTLVRLILKRQRIRSGLSLSAVAERLGASSRNTYARYEQGRSVPTIDKLDQLLRAVSPDRDIVIEQSRDR